ncbi:MAG: PDZ domain-containing protein [Chitinophagaceae bacterium]
MKKTFIALLALNTCFFTQAQEKKESNESKEVVIEKKKNKDGKTIEERKITVDKNGKKSKTTIVIDNNKVTINGKPVEELKEKEIDLIVEETMDELRDVMPNNSTFKRSLKRNLAPERIKEFRRSFNAFPKNKALLGVAFTTNENGAVVNDVEEKSAAEKAGLQKDDIITKINEQEINENNTLDKVIGQLKPNDEINISYKRNGKTQTTKATLNENKNEVFEIEMDDIRELPNMDFFKEMPFNNEGFKFNFQNKPKLGLKIQDVEDTDGVEVLELTENSVAAKAGLQKGDIIKKIEGETIKNVDNFRQKTRSFNEGDLFKIEVLRNGKLEEISIKFPKKLKTAEL